MRVEEHEAERELEETRRVCKCRNTGYVEERGRFKRCPRGCAVVQPLDWEKR